ncbi:D-inositol 3-phosphate glycosyltransferase [Planktothrix tepida]|uniref:Glycosyl transferase group 1 n=2 Tax=Planktothrix TaxID=54304 RepID=A0A1J1LSY1_9CYAN|nr:MULTISPECIES: glycosyltransferase family 4 protein [Planktothrix]CAD5919260.1 D-inositol 3-phosphate glycosyltransferase [Planktothrix pseudagardhii]CAD5981889.1 D-inositol 3-phosphate glycosyltransferase [Planktothrix tepida]CUR35715.1 Glycosyl transferase group 1 [Planktothrix tepida PCC 9214]
MNKSKKIKVLMVVEQCNPNWSSVPLEGYKYFQQISELVDVTLVTHERNQKDLKSRHSDDNIIFIPESKLAQKYYRNIVTLASKGTINWPLAHTLSYPIYAEFNHRVYQQFKDEVLQRKYDIVHALTPMIPRYPVKLINACQNTPFLLGPVNGGVPFPPGFQKIAKKEFANLNFLRSIGRMLIPGYLQTYQKADQVLSGSTYTLNWLKDSLKVSDDHIDLFYENGIDPTFLTDQPKTRTSDRVNLLFVGRLVPYKCADILIDAIAQLENSIQQKVHLTIVGDGSERTALEASVKQLNLQELVTFTGWVKQEQTLEFYQNSDLFCFPSIREFGGAVVLEAMACGLPCIVVNNGGIGEYVTETTGFKIEPISRDFIRDELTQKIQTLVENEPLWQSMSAQSIQRAKDFLWTTKAQKIVNIYQQLSR